MAHRGNALGKDVCCIDDLKRLGSGRLTQTIRGMSFVWPVYIAREIGLTKIDYYNGGAMDLIRYSEKRRKKEKKRKL